MIKSDQEVHVGGFGASRKEQVHYFRNQNDLYNFLTRSDVRPFIEEMSGRLFYKGLLFTFLNSVDSKGRFRAGFKLSKKNTNRNTKQTKEEKLSFSNKMNYFDQFHNLKSNGKNSKTSSNFGFNGNGGGGNGGKKTPNGIKPHEFELSKTDKLDEILSEVGQRNLENFLIFGICMFGFREDEEMGTIPYVPNMGMGRIRIRKHPKDLRWIGEWVTHPNFQKKGSSTSSRYGNKDKVNKNIIVEIYKPPKWGRHWVEGSGIFNGQTFIPYRDSEINYSYDYQTNQFYFYEWQPNGILYNLKREFDNLKRAENIMNRQQLDSLQKHYLLTTNLTGIPTEDGKFQNWMRLGYGAVRGFQSNKKNKQGEIDILPSNKGGKMLNPVRFYQLTPGQHDSYTNASPAPGHINDQQNRNQLQNQHIAMFSQMMGHSYGRRTPLQTTPFLLPNARANTDPVKYYFDVNTHRVGSTFGHPTKYNTSSQFKDVARFSTARLNTIVNQGAVFTRNFLTLVIKKLYMKIYKITTKGQIRNVGKELQYLSRIIVSSRPVKYMSEQEMSSLLKFGEANPQFYSDVHEHISGDGLAFLKDYKGPLNAIVPHGGGDPSRGTIEKNGTSTIKKQTPEKKETKSRKRKRSDQEEEDEEEEGQPKKKKRKVTNSFSQPKSKIQFIKNQLLGMSEEDMVELIGQKYSKQQLSSFGNKIDKYCDDSNTFEQILETISLFDEDLQEQTMENSGVQDNSKSQLQRIAEEEEEEEEEDSESLVLEFDSMYPTTYPEDLNAEGRKQLPVILNENIDDELADLDYLDFVV